MIKKVPVIYPSESVYSWLARMFAQSGIIYHKYFVKEIFLNPDELIDYNFINLFGRSFKKFVRETMGFKELLLNHTLFKHYARYMEVKERLEVYEIGISNNELLMKKLHIPPNRTDYYLRYCPYCVREDRKKYGECYFHIEHQIFEIRTCPIHLVDLIDTRISNDKGKETTFVTLEQLNPVEDGTIRIDSEMDTRVSVYIYEVFKSGLILHNDVLVSDYLSSKLNRTQCVDNACTKKNVIKLTKDIVSFYEELSVKNLRNHRICDVYRGSNINPYDILLVALFQGIETSKVANPKMKKEEIRRPIMRYVIELTKTGMIVQEIAEVVGRDERQVQRIIVGYEKTKLKSSHAIKIR